MGTLATLLRRYRLAAGLSQAELAERANISVGAIGSLEQGLRRAPYSATLEKLADVLGVTRQEREELFQSAKRVRALRHSSERTFQSTVPKPLSTFIRREETDELARLLVQNRLVTVTGSAGVGKTRTVLEVVGRHESGDVVFIDLSPISDPDLVAGEVASAFRMPASGTTDVLEELVVHVRDRRVLVVLDNCEHLLGAASATVLELLRSCAALRFVTTSREPLGLTGEILFRLPSLRIPPEGVDLRTTSHYPAVELFITRAQAADALFAYSPDDLNAVADICRRLDGIPLAIELAASRAPVFGVNGLRERLNVLALDNVAKDTPARHQTMMAAIAWSFTLLSPEERELIGRLSTLAGTFTLACAEAVCADETLTPDLITRLLFQLAQKSLVEPKVTRPVHRYEMLDSVRAYAAQSAGGRNQHAISDRLAAWLLSFVRNGNDGLTDVISMLPELDNIRAAIEAKLHNGSNEDIAVAGELVGSYRHLWISTNRRHELRQLSGAVMARLDEEAYVSIAAVVATAMAAASSSYHEVEIYDRAIALNEKAGNFAAASAHLSRLAWNYFYLGRPEKALVAADLAEETIRRVPPSHRAQHFVRTQTSHVYLQNNDASRARRTIAELDLIKAQNGMSDDSDFVLLRGFALAEIYYAEANYVDAIALCAETIAKCATYFSQDPKWIGLWVIQIESELKLGHIDDAAARCRQYLVDLPLIEYGLGEYLNDAHLLQDVAEVAAKRGDFQNAARLLACADASLERFRYVRSRHRGIDADGLRTLLQLELDPRELANLQVEGARMTHNDARELMLRIVANDAAVKLSE